MGQNFEAIDTLYSLRPTSVLFLNRLYILEQCKFTAKLSGARGSPYTPCAPTYAQPPTQAMFATIDETTLHVITKAQSVKLAFTGCCTFYLNRINV